MNFWVQNVRKKKTQGMQEKIKGYFKYDDIRETTILVVLCLLLRKFWSYSSFLKNVKLPLYMCDFYVRVM